MGMGRAECGRIVAELHQRSNGQSREWPGLRSFPLHFQDDADGTNATDADARTRRPEARATVFQTEARRERPLNPNSETGMGSARLRRASSGVAPELSSD